MVRRTTSDAIVFSLANLPATPRQRILAFAVAVVLVMAFAIAAPFATTPLPRLDAAIPTLVAIIFVNDLITSVLLFAQYCVFPSVAILVLAGGYLFTALIVIPYALTFPGAFASAGLLGADLQSSAWLYNFWHIGSPAVIFAYAVLKDADRVSTGSVPSVWFAVGWTVALAIGLVSLLTWVTTALKQFLPPLFFADAIQLRTVSVSYVVVIQILVAMVTLTALWIRRRSVLDYWLMLVILAFVSEELLFGLFSTTRFSLGWYAGRAFSLATSMFVLVLLLGEITRLYARLARTNMVLERERDNKLMNVQAVAAAISHEIRQPLGVIAANTETALIYLEQTPRDFEKTRSILAEVVAETERASQILQGIRAVFGKSDGKGEAIDMNEVARGALSTFRDALTDNEIATRLQLAPELPLVMGNKGQLQEVVANLVHNAVEALEAIKDDHRILTVRTENQRNDEIILEIEDTGAGIDPGVSDKIFDAFVTTKSQGTGLGLAICQTIIERHNGRISVSAAHPHGSVFRIVLPAHRGPHVA